jgi:hypothetical protein
MNKQLSIHGLQNDIAELKEQLDDAQKGIIEWREVALEALTAIKAMQDSIDCKAYHTARCIGQRVSSKYPI